jgi:hypothetical protein
LIIEVREINIYKQNNMNKYKVIFYDYANEESPIEQLFDSKIDAMDFAESGMWEEDYEYIGNDGEDYFATRNRYFNKDYNESFFSYSIEEVPSELNEQFIRMQKLAGIFNPLLG